MAISLNKTITRTADNTIDENTIYYDLNTKAHQIVEDVVGKVETELTSAETQINSQIGALQSAEQYATSAANSASTVQAIYDSADASVVARNSVSSSGYLTKVKQEDRWLETNTPNVIVDKVGDDYVIDGVVYRQLGNELVTNGTFDSDIDWNTGTGWTISGGVATSSGINGDKLTQQIPLSQGDTVLISLDIVSTDGGNLRLYERDGGFGTLYPIDTNIVGTGTKTFIYTIQSSNPYLNVYDGTVVCSIDNISVKELKQATLPLAPFATGSTDELLDDKVNGLTTQQAHSKGDIVVTGNELVTNGTFDSDSDWVKEAGWSISEGTAQYSSGSTGNSLYQSIETIVGAEYILTVDVKSINGMFQIGVRKNSIFGSIVEYKDVSNEGLITLRFTAISTTSTVAIKDYGDSIALDNISVRLADTSYQAITDTTAGDLLSDTSKFQVIPDVTRHDIITLTPSGYKTYKGLNYYQDDTLDRDTIASDRGWSKLGNNTYVDEDGDKVAIVGVRPTLNAGAFHPNYNFYGTATYWGRTGSLYDNPYAKWYEDPFNYWDNPSLYGTLLKRNYYVASDFSASSYTNAGSISSGKSSRPDSKFYDKVYSQGEGGLIQLGYNYAKDDIDLDIEASKLVSGDMGVQSGVEVIKTFGNDSNLLYDYSNTTIAIYFDFYAPERYSIGDYVSIHYFNGSSVYSDLRCKVTEVVTNGIKVNNAINISAITASGYTTRNNTNYFMVVSQSQTHLTKGTALTTDLIGDPTNYPSFLKNTLASGKSVHINPLLVSDSGVSLIPDDTSKEFKLSRKCTTVFASSDLRSTDNGETYLGTTLMDDFSFISNSKQSFTATSGHLYILPYISANTPAVQSTPKKVVKVLPKVVASNSHSIYKGGLLTNAVTGKVSIGNGANGLESKYLESIELDETSNIQTTPTHSTLALDNANSPATKYFTALSIDDNNEYCLDIYGEELAYNTVNSSYDGDDETFEQLTNGVLTDLNANTVQTKVLSKKLGVFKK